jgi:hypothetical protein
MKTLDEIWQHPDVMAVQTGKDGGAGYVRLGRRMSDMAWAVWSNGGGWDHVSVSFKTRCPSWEEMCRAKDIFFNEDECCVEYHPARADYVNRHPFCLHIWKPQDKEIPKPPKEYV